MIRVWLGRLRTIGLWLALAGGSAAFVWVVNDHYPLQHWLFWRFLKVWAFSALFVAACLSAGVASLRFLVPGSLRLAERVALGFAMGVLEFFLGMFVFGLLGLYGGWFFFVFPLLMLGLGARGCLRFGRSVWRHLRRARRSAQPTPLWLFPLLGFGLVGLGLVYFNILTPENAAFDSRWQHLGLAEHYSAAGRLTRFPEGWWVASSPHLAAILYTWAFLAPFSMLFDHVELAAHVEFACFLFTLVGVGALVRRILPRTRARGAWVARFLFPGVLLYDSSPTIAADHVAAVFAAPILLATFFVWRRMEWRWMAVLAAGMAGAVMTKYTGALLLVAGPLLAVALRVPWLGFRWWRQRQRPRLRPAWLLGLGVAVAAGVTLTAPHWLKNWVWHGDPLYPVAYKHFSPEPWTADAAERFEYGFVKTNLWQPEKNWTGVKESLKALITFSFVPNDWKIFHGKVPVFGSLFTLGLFCLPFVRGPPRLWAAYGAMHLGLFTWYWTHHQDRYLQAAVPWMASALAAVLILAWQSGVVAKLLVSLLVGLQVVWGGDVFFIPGHAMTTSAPKRVIDLLNSGYRKDYMKRLRPYGGYYEVGMKLPRDARVLVHDFRPRLGLRAQTVNDAPANQGGISYGELGSPRAAHELLKSFRATHLLWTTGKSAGADSIAGDLVFFDLALNFSSNAQRVSQFTLAELPAEPPPATNQLVAYFSCSRNYPAGIYRIDQLQDHGYHPLDSYPRPLELAPPRGQAAPRLLARVRYVAVDTRCERADQRGVGGDFERVGSRRWEQLWVRRAGR